MEDLKTKGETAVRWTKETPTANLKWTFGVLQQRWDVVNVENGVEVTGFSEWRNIPGEIHPLLK